MISRAALLALDAQLATTAAQIATMRAQIAAWVELPIPAAPPSPRGTAEAGSGSPASAADGTPGASAKDRIADVHNSEPGTLPPAPETRPLARTPRARPAGSSLRGRLLDFLALHAETGTPLPTDLEIAHQLDTTQEHVSVELCRIRKREGIAFGGDRLSRIVIMPDTPPERMPKVGPNGEPSRVGLSESLLALLREHAASGAALPPDRELAERFGAKNDRLRETLKYLRRKHGITTEGRKAGRIVTMPGVERAPETSTMPETRPTPAPPPRKPSAEREEIERYIATKGVTKLPTAFADESTGSSTEAERAAIARHREEQDARRREEHQARLDRAQGRAPTLVKARA